MKMFLFSQILSSRFHTITKLDEPPAKTPIYFHHTRNGRPSFGNHRVTFVTENTVLWGAICFYLLNMIHLSVETKNVGKGALEEL